MSGTVNIPAVGVLMRNKNKVLLVLRENTNWMNGYYTLPAGHVEAGESFSQAAIRELKEEVGIVASVDQLTHRITLHESKEQEGKDEVRIAVIFELNNWEGEPHNAEPHMHSEVAWFDIDNLPENLVPFTKIGMELMRSGKSYDEFGWSA